MPSAFREMSENFGLFIVGAIWAGAGFLSVVVSDAFLAWATGKPIEWHHTFQLAGLATAPALAAYWKSHKNLLALPQSVQGKLNLAQDATLKANAQIEQIVSEAGDVHLPSIPVQLAQSDKIQTAVAALKDLKVDVK